MQSSSGRVHQEALGVEAKLGVYMGSVGCGAAATQMHMMLLLLLLLLLYTFSIYLCRVTREVVVVVQRRQIRT